MVVDDHQLFREGVRDVLTRHGIAIAGEAADAAEAVALAAAVKPEVALMAVKLPDASGVDAAKRIRRVAPATKVLMLTASASEDDVSDALQAGACGYLLKESSEEEIIAGIRAAVDGHSPLSPQVAALILDRLRGSLPTVDSPEDGVPDLTERELEVLCMIAAGRENAEIAEALVISQHTVKSHVSSILAKLGVENRIQAAVYAVRKRLVSGASGVSDWNATARPPTPCRGCPASRGSRRRGGERSPARPGAARRSPPY
jgi:DNA-binding NarL/FixJ family response regulator